MPWSLWLLILTLALAPAPAYADKDMLDLSVSDTICRPGDEAVLTAKLEKNSLTGSDIEDATIEFRIDGKTAGTAKTDSDGIATLRVPAPAAGEHTVKALFEGDESNLRAEYNALLAVWPADRKIMVLDIDWTISMTHNLNTAIGSADSPPLKEAAEVVTRLARDHAPVYLTARARQLRKKTLSWLTRYDFPRGPTFFLNPKEYPTYNEAKYKKTVLKPLRAIYPNMKIGFGNKESDVEAYKATGIASVLITDRNIPDATCVKDWASVEKALGAAATR